MIVLDGYVGPTLPCWFWIRPGQQGRRQVISETAVVTVEIPMLLAPKGADVMEGDRINGIADRRGKVVYGGILSILSVVPVHDHQEITCEAVA